MKRWLHILIGLAFVAMIVWIARAEESAPLPQITVEQKLDYQRARANLANTQAQLDAAQKALQASIDTMQKVCADRPLIADAKGDPTCGIAQPVVKEN